MTKEDKKLKMEFDMNTIQHLGISMYSTLPPVIAEIIANSWDADSNEVNVELFDDFNKSIIISDNGNGMSFEDINEKYLIIGRNKRIKEKKDITNKLKRRVIGRKGIGKLSIFGIAEEVSIITIREGIKNKFQMSLNTIKNSDKIYYPEHVIKEEKTDEKNGTVIELTKLKRRSKFSPDDLALDLARRFLIFDDNFKVWITYNNDKKNKILINNEMRFKDLDIEYKWTFPNDKFKSDFEYKDNVNGIIYTAEKPVPENIKGVYLIARGKLVHKNDFYGIRSSDYAHAYLTGWLNVDYIDEDIENDLISTHRESIVWENEEMEDLRDYIQKIINYVTTEWRKNRSENKEKKIKERTGINLKEWLSTLPTNDRKIAKKMLDVILSDPIIDIDKSSELIEYIKGNFEFESFKEFASELDESELLTDSNIIKLLKDWKVIEAREFYKIAIVRIETINKFANYIESEVKEVPTMHNFLKEFPWLLDPRIMNFDDEVTYSKLLRDKFNENELPEEDRRIDFLCIDFGNNIFIIELKRPGHKINKENLNQAVEYLGFLKQYFGNSISKSPIAIIIGGGHVNKEDFEILCDSLRKDDKVHIKTYHEILSGARKYHQEFIDKYDKMKESFERKDD